MPDPTAASPAPTAPEAQPSEGATRDFVLAADGSLCDKCHAPAIVCDLGRDVDADDAYFCADCFDALEGAS